MKNPELRHFILQIALKCADISNPCRPWEVSRKWSLKVCDEFFRQGDYERQLGLPVTDICDRYNNTVPKIQTGTYKQKYLLFTIHLSPHTHKYCIYLQIQDKHSFGILNCVHCKYIH